MIEDQIKMAHLNSGSGRVNLAQKWKEVAQKELLECLDKCAGSKAIVWDDPLISSVGLIAEYSLLKENEVEKMFPLRAGRLPQNNVQNVIFITRPILKLMRLVAENIREEEKVGSFRKEYHILFVPGKSLLCENKLKELGVYGTLNNIGEFGLELLPLDSDLLSMDMTSIFKECYLYRDPTGMFYMAKALMKIQALYGVIPNIYGKGEYAKQVSDMILRMRRELAVSERQITPQIDTVLLLDRTVDLLTPLATQLTYEGLIDEIYGISNTTVKLPAAKFAKKNEGDQTDVTAEPKKFHLNSGDELFSVLRDRNFHAVGTELSKKAKILSAQVEERKGARTVGEIKEFVSKLPHITAAKQSLATHTSIAELVKEVTDKDTFLETLHMQQEFLSGSDTDKVNNFIEDCIGKREPLVKVLRLVCMQSLTNSGLKPKVLDFYKREILQTYGFEHIVTLHNLEKIGLLKQQGQKSYSTIRKTLKLVMEEVNEQNPNDISYVFSGYAPLSVRLAQYLARPGWRSIEEALRLLPGPLVEEQQQIPVGLRKKRPPGGDADNQKVTLVVFLGGVTFAEIAALRFLSQQEDAPTDYIIITTQVMNGRTWMESLMENLSVSNQEEGGASPFR